MEGLKFRHELKYYITYKDYMLLKNRLQYVMSYDKYCNDRGEYHVRSLYFDDFKNTALHEKLSGVLNRHKYRVRIYNKNSSVINLEKKIKRDGFIAKQKQSLSLNESTPLISDRFHSITLSGKPLFQEMLIEMQASLLKPKVIVDYIREAYTSPLGNTRITFDKDLRTGLRDFDVLNPDLLTIKALDNNFIIMEVKFDEYLPSHIQNLIQLESLAKQSVSKYFICTKHIKNTFTKARVANIKSQLDGTKASYDMGNGLAARMPPRGKSESLGRNAPDSENSRKQTNSNDGIKTGPQERSQQPTPEEGGRLDLPELVKNGTGIAILLSLCLYLGYHNRSRF